jgi:hypothetical protein
MMNKHSDLSQRDLETLSAYLDGQLDDRRRRKLEARLQSEPGLREALESLRAVVKGLQGLPVPRPSRHFTLTSDMVGEAEPRRAFPVLRFATALAGLAFVALVGIEGLQSISASQLSARAPAVMQESERAMDEIAAAEEPQAAEPFEETAPEAEAMEMPAGEEPAEEPLMMEQPEQEQAQKLTGTPEASVPPEAAAGEQDEGQSYADNELEGQEQQVGEVAAAEGVPPETTPTGNLEGAERAAAYRLSPLRWLQVITGALFILLSVLTITFRRRST